MAGSTSLDIPDDRLAILTIDAPGRKVNTLGHALFGELARHLDRLESTAEVVGLLLRSGKPGQFVAGADLAEVRALSGRDRSEAADFIGVGVAVLDRLANLPFPTACLIDGPCLGGGAELALATDARFFSDNLKTRFGLPEIGLGLIPSWGGTQRLPRLAGLDVGSEMILGGSPIDPARAILHGIGAAIVPTESLEPAARAWLARSALDLSWKARRAARSSLVPMGEVATPTSNPSDLPGRVAELIRRGARLALPEAIALESALAAELMTSAEAGRRIDVFFARPKSNS